MYFCKNHWKAAQSLHVQSTNPPSKKRNIHYNKWFATQLTNSLYPCVYNSCNSVIISTPTVRVKFRNKNSDQLALPFSVDKCAHNCHVLYSQVVTSITWTWMQVSVSSKGSGIQFGIFSGGKANTTWDPIQVWGF